VLNNIADNPHQTQAPFNDSYIVLIPKKEDACKTTEFRPISLVNGVQKIFSKLLAKRLQHHMGRFLTEAQTRFVKRRNILHGFHYAQDDWSGYKVKATINIVQS
jgi:hypothetical protein